MAEALLRSWHAPSVVSDVEIDASRGVVVREESSRVDSVRVTSGLSWRQVDSALPMPSETMDGTVGLALRCSDFSNSLNQETLRVTGLASGAYQLIIDDQAVGIFQQDQLGKGINLASMQTPMFQQAQSVLLLTYKHNHIHFARWAMVEGALKEYHLPKTQAAIDALDAVEADVVSLQRTTAAPKPHWYRLVKQ